MYTVFVPSTRKSIFLFLSNTGGPNITSVMLDLWRANKKRGEVSMNDLENLIQLGAFNEHGDCILGLYGCLGDPFTPHEIFVIIEYNTEKQFVYVHEQYLHQY